MEAKLWKSILCGLAAGAMCLLIFSLLAAAMIEKGYLEQERIAVVGAIVTVMSSFAAGFTAGRLQRGKLLITCTAASMLFLCCLLFAKAAFFSGWSACLIPGLIGTMASGVVASLIPTGKRRSRRKH